MAFTTPDENKRGLPLTRPLAGGERVKAYRIFESVRETYGPVA